MHQIRVSFLEHFQPKAEENLMVNYLTLPLPIAAISDQIKQRISVDFRSAGVDPGFLGGGGGALPLDPTCLFLRVLVNGYQS